MPDCMACGQNNPARARFCMSCASPLRVEEPAPRGARKTVTVVFCDVVESTAIAERLDPESVREVMTQFFREMRSVLEHHGGTVEKFIGDAVMAVFGVPLLHEDDALRAIKSAQAMRAALGPLNADLRRRLDVTLRTRIGMNTGEVVVGDPGAGQALVVGDAVNVAARLQQAARPGEIFVGPATYALVREYVSAAATTPLRLKGKTEPIASYRVTAVASSLDVIGARLDPPLVGRQAELGHVRSTFDRIAATRVCSLLTVIGSAGVGKSRLAREFVAPLPPDVAVLRGRCLPYGEGITFWPVGEVVKQACGITDQDNRDGASWKIGAALEGADDRDLIADRVASVTGFATAAAGLQETFWSIRRFLEWVGRDRPLVVIFDDLQWAEPTFLDLVEYLAGWTRETPVLLLCLARPDLMDVRPTWASGAPDASTLPLAPLGEQETKRFITELLGRATLDDGILGRIEEAAGGNPLFLEEMLRMFEDDKLLHREDGRWIASPKLRDIRVPETIQALLGARLDRLSSEERIVIRCASVIGKVFWWGAVAELANEEVRPHVGAHLQTLVRKDLIRAEQSTLAGEDAFRFHHILIQEEAYRGTPKEIRADLHERLVAWIDTAAGDRTLEVEEVIGYHLEQAYRYRSELGAAGQQQRALATRAARTLAVAAARVVERRDMPAAADLLGRSAELFAPDDPERRTVLLDLAEVLAEIGELGRAEAVLDEAERVAGASGDVGMAANASILRLFLLESTDPKRLSGEAVPEAERSIAMLQSVHDDLGVARAWRLMGDLYWTHARYSSADKAFGQAIEHARRAGALREEGEALGMYAGSGAYGPAHVSKVELRCEELASKFAGTGHEAPALRALAGVRAMQGHFDEARELAARARSILEDFGMRLRASWVSETAGQIEMLAGDHRAAERELRNGFDVATVMGEQGFRSTVAALLAHALLEQGRFEEADRLTRVSHEEAAEDDLASQVLWRTARARILAANGDSVGAEPLARDAIALVETTDDVNMHAGALVDLAEVLGANEREAAAEALTDALGFYVAKGNVVAAESTRRRRDTLRRSAPSREAT